MLVSSLVASIRRTLNDADAVTFSDSDIVAAVNEAISALCIYRPDAAAKTAVVTLAPGTKQALPTDGVRLIRVVRNRGTDGTSIGRAIHQCDLATLDDISPGWHQLSGNYIAEYAFDPLSPREYWTYPAVPSGGLYAEILYSQRFATVALTDSLPVDDVYSQPLKEWALYVLWGGDTDSSPNYSQAIGRRDTFFNLLQVRTAADKGAQPAIVKG